MKRLGHILFGAVATMGFAHAASLQTNPQATSAPGVLAPLAPTALSQMTNNTPVTMGGVSCSNAETGTTSATSWWRRFYLAEHGAPSSVTIESVTIAAETGSAPVTINLYAIPHAVAANTIAPQHLRLIGRSALTMVNGQLDTTTIPVVGTLIDAVNNDLVVEFHTDGNPSSAFYAGGNASTQTHEAFISADPCGIPTPTLMSEVDFPDAHMIIVANAAEPGVSLAATFTPDVVMASAPSTLTITLVNPLASVANLSSGLTNTLPSGLQVAAQPNDSTTCGGSLSATAGAGSISLASAGAQIPANGYCTITVDVSSSAGDTYTNTLAAGALVTDQGSNAYATHALLTVIPVGGNGIIRSGNLGHVVIPNQYGTSFNIVKSSFNDAGLRGADWDFNFSLGLNEYSMEGATLTYKPIEDNQSEILVDGNGQARLLRDGDVVGPGDTFSSNEAVAPDSEWMTGADGAVGVRFKCNGRLTYPVAGGHCYGYIRIASTNTTGFPARIIEAAFDGDANPITVSMPTAVNPPAASITPVALSFNVAANLTAMRALDIANAPGSLPLRYALSAQGQAGALAPRAQDLAKSGTIEDTVGQALFPERLSRLPSPLIRSATRGHATTPWSSPEGTAYILDDGSYENIIGIATVPGVWLNRFPVVGAQTLNSVSVMWPRQYEGGSLIGLQANIVAYYDADADGDPSNAVRLGSDHIVTITALDNFQVYATDFEVPGAGDIYVGFVEQWAINGTTMTLASAAIDMDMIWGKAYMSINFPSDEAFTPLDLDNLGNNQATMSVQALTSGYLGGSWLVRATGVGANCSGPGVPWLTVSSLGDTVVGGASTSLTVKVDPAAAGLQAGNYSAELCITTNDPAQETIMLPVSLQVSAELATHSCGHLGDGIFCAGFEDASANDIVHSNVANVSLPNNSQGMSFNFALGEWSTLPYYGDDWAGYRGGSMSIAETLLFYWHGDMQPGMNGGVAETVVGPYRLLKAGDTIGPGSTFSQVASGSYGETTHFLAGVDGYLGYRFLNEETGQINYGYVHLVTSWPNGYPATVVGFAYNRSGGPITIP